MRGFDRLTPTEQAAARDRVAAELRAAIAAFAMREVEAEPVERSRVMLRRDQYYAVQEAMRIAADSPALQALVEDVVKRAHYPEETDAVVPLAEPPTDFDPHPEHVPSASKWAVIAIESIAPKLREAAGLPPR